MAGTRSTKPTRRSSAPRPVSGKSRTDLRRSSAIPGDAASRPVASESNADDAPSARLRSDPAPEVEFMRAMQDYKVASGRMFPTWSEVLEVLQSLGYRKRDEAQAEASS